MLSLNACVIRNRPMKEGNHGCDRDSPIGTLMNGWPRGTTQRREGESHMKITPIRWQGRKVTSFSFNFLEPMWKVVLS